MRIDTLEEFYVESLKNLYHAEHQVLRALPGMANAAISLELRRLIHAHAAEVRNQLDRLDIIFDGIKTEPLGKQCKAMAGMLAESDELFHGEISEFAIDSALIAAAQRIEHYELAGYGSLRTYARLLGEGEATELFDETLREVGDFGDVLAALAETSITDESHVAIAI